MLRWPISSRILGNRSQGPSCMVARWSIQLPHCCFQRKTRKAVEHHSYEQWIVQTSCLFTFHTIETGGAKPIVLIYVNFLFLIQLLNHLSCTISFSQMYSDVWFDRRCDSTIKTRLLKYHSLYGFHLIPYSINVCFSYTEEGFLFYLHSLNQKGVALEQVQMAFRCSSWNGR